MKTLESVMNILVLCALSRWDREMLLKQKYQQADRYLLKIEDNPRWGSAKISRAHQEKYPCLLKCKPNYSELGHISATESNETE